MPRTKNALIRQRVIDQCLSSSQNYSMEDLKKACNRELQNRGEHPVTSTNTIRDDLDQISANYPDAIIESKRVGRNIYYSYRDKNYSIFNIPFKDDEVAQLTQTLMILSRFEGMPQFDWMEDFINRFKSSLKLNFTNEPIVGFDENIDLRGREYFAPLFSAISNKQVLEIAYKNFKKGIIENYTIHPYYLKQYNNRWFLFGLTEEVMRLSVLAFDRIESINPVYRNYIPNKQIDFQEYFEDLIGVSRPYGEEPQKIVLKVSKELIPYIRTKPLHGTQREISSDENHVTIQLEVIINFELEQLILSHGEKLEVIAPVAFREKIKERIHTCAKLYE